MDDDLAVLKKAHRAMWGSGDYDSIAELILTAGRGIVARTGVKAGDDVLDVACGTGNAAVAAAVTGGRVTGVDLTPELFPAARARATAAGVEVDWREGDAEALPFGDASFDVVVSTFGCMFAPRHEVTAGELARVLRPGGRLGLCNWTPEGWVGEFFRTIAAHLPPPAGPPPLLWGTEGHVRSLFDGTGIELEFDRDEVVFVFESAEAAADKYADRFGPVVKAREVLTEQGGWDAFRADFVGLFERNAETPGGQVTIPGEYLVVVGRKAGGAG
ncbi:MAG TPA: class I SAM-dependent methyltransferase [Acidimicrobiia bacterium]|nr:class I SAM-dependent methyltransferase [Acidimicrobiia bacterium]